MRTKKKQSRFAEEPPYPPCTLRAEGLLGLYFSLGHSTSDHTLDST